MATQLGDGEMTTVSFQVAYDGESGGHTMDVQLLGPALLAFGEIIREANAVINGGRSRVQVLVRSDFEHKCFNIDFQVVQTFFEQVKSFLALENTKTAKELLEWIGIIGGPTVVGGLLGLLRLKAENPVKNVTRLEDADKRGVVAVEFGDGATVGHVEVHHHVWQLSENPKVLSAVAKALEPVQTPDFDRVEFRQNDKPIRVIPRSEAEKIREACAVSSTTLTVKEETRSPPIETVLEVLGPEYDEEAKNWRFWYGETPIFADISETEIARDAIRRGGVAVGDRYRVMMEITQHQTKKRITNHYKIVKVLEFIPAPVDLFGYAREIKGSDEE